MLPVRERLQALKSGQRKRRRHDPNMPRVVGLIRRWSTPSQNTNYSNDRQFSIMEHRIRALGMTPRQYDEGQVSGGNLLKRDDAIHLLQDIQDGVVHGIAAIDLKRIGREETGSDISLILSICAENDAIIVTETDVYDAKDASDVLQVKILSAIASLERTTIRDTMVRGKAGRLIKGPPTNAAMAPFGYEHVFAGTRASGEITRTIKKCPEDSYAYKVICRLFEIAQTAPSLTAIARQLKAEGLYYVSRKGPRKGLESDWDHQTVRNVISKPIYGGWLVFNSDTEKGVWHSQPEFADGPVKREVPELSYVSPETLERLQKRLLIDIKSRGPRGRNGPHPLMGVIRCRHCGSTTFNHKGYKGAYAYLCSMTRIQSGVCKGQSVMENLAIGAVFSLIRVFYQNSREDFAAAADAVIGADYSQALRDAKDRLRILETRRETVINTMTMMDPDPKEMVVWQKRLQDLREQIRQAEETVATQTALVERQHVLDAVPTGSAFVPVFMDLPWQIQRDIFKAWFRTVRVESSGPFKKRQAKVVAYQLWEDDQETWIDGPAYPSYTEEQTPASSSPSVRRLFPRYLIDTLLLVAS